MTYQHLGRVSNTSHPANPLAIGDFAVMKSWKGDPDGGDDSTLVELATGTILIHDLHLTAPDLFRATPDELVLLVEPEHRGTILDSYTLDELQPELAGPFAETYGSWTLEIRSGAVVVTLAYNATPEEGSDTDDLDELCFHEEKPMLPKQVPTEPVVSTDRYVRELAIIPLPPGTYAVVDGRTPRKFMKLVIRRERP